MLLARTSVQSVRAEETLLRFYVKPFWGLRATRGRLCVLRVLLYFFCFLEAQITISLVFYRELVRFLDRFLGGVKIMTIFRYCLYAKMLQN